MFSTHVLVTNCSYHYHLYYVSVYNSVFKILCADKVYTLFRKIMYRNLRNIDVSCLVNTIYKLLSVLSVTVGYSYRSR